MTNNQQTNSEGDVVLIHYQDQPAVYARIDAIEPDAKKDWYQITLLFLTIPAQQVTWILREEYINGASFTMGGQSLRLEKVERVSYKEKPEDASHSSGQKGAKKPARVIPFKKQ